MSSRSSTSFARLRKKFHFILLASFFTVSALECSKQAEYRDIDQGDEEVEMEADLNDEAEAEIELEIERPFDSEDELDAADEEPRLDFEEKDEDADLSEEENEPEITDELEDATDEASDEKDGEGIGEAPDSADDDDEAPDEEDEDQTTEEEDAKDYLDDVELFDEEAEEGLCYDCEVQCQSGEDCRGLSFVCIDGRCAHCVSDAQCKDEITGGYDERAKCFNGICASDWCETGFDCPDGKPACREGFVPGASTTGSAD